MLLLPPPNWVTCGEINNWTKLSPPSAEKKKEMDVGEVANSPCYKHYSLKGHYISIYFSTYFHMTTGSYKCVVLQKFKEELKILLDGIKARNPMPGTEQGHSRCSSICGMNENLLESCSRQQILLSYEDLNYKQEQMKSRVTFFNDGQSHAPLLRTLIQILRGPSFALV